MFAEYIGFLNETATCDCAARLYISSGLIKFTKFVSRLRNRFNSLFHDLLKTQLILKGIATIEDWETTLSQTIKYEYVNDGYFAEIKESEMFKDRMATYRDVKDSGMLGTVLSRDYMMKRILKFSEAEIIEQQEKIADEIKAGLYKGPGDDEEQGDF